MIKAVRITLEGDKTYQGVEIYKSDEIECVSYFDDDQLEIVCPEAKIITSKYQISIIQLDTYTKRFPSGNSNSYKRIGIFYELTYGPVQVLKPGLSKKLGIPLVFENDEQFVFCCSEGLFITTEYNVTLIER